jgi:DNA-binding XRE family transcriptional regulator
MEKFRRLSKALGIPVEAIVKNDLNKIPLSFFDENPEPEYRPTPKSAEAIQGREGEELILRREKDRLQESFPVLAKLVIPFFKKNARAVGYDILSFDDTGKPVCLEVKTSTMNVDGFKLSVNELTVAKRCEKKGQAYVVVHIANWGTLQQIITDMRFCSLQETHVFDPMSYYCRPKPKAESGVINGLAYFRRPRGLRQAQIASALGIQQGKWSLYENGHIEPSVETYLKISDYLEATLDELLAQYDACELDTDEAPV